MDTSPTPNVPHNEELIARLCPPAVPIRPRSQRPFSYWARKLLVCNPFYLVSAALLLYGFYLVSTDANFPGKELAQLTFNFSSLQFYEVLLVGTAVVLARRRIWYDSNLLIFLENGLILVPFILVSEAALISPNVVRIMCAIGGAMALFRYASLKRLHRPLNLPPKLLGCGLVLLVVNVALPLIYRTLHESKVGTKPTDGAAFVMNEYSWLMILPTMIALANCLPRPIQSSDLLPQRRWIPAGLFTLWLAGSAVHLCCLGYVYNFDWEMPFLVPPVWALAWTAFNRHADFSRARGLRSGLLAAPLVMTFVAAACSAPRMFLVLTSLNILAYAILFLKNRTDRTALHLILLSVVALALSWVKLLEPRLPSGLNTGTCIQALITAYACFWIGVSRHPKLGILGAIIVGISAGTLFDTYFDGPHFGIQAGLVFLLLHSLLWEDEAHLGARAGRIFAGSVWMLHSLFLIVAGWPHAGAVLASGATLVLAACIARKLACGQWPPLVLSISAGAVLVLPPCDYLRFMPVGLWVVAGSFLLFAFGTLFALKRSKWIPTPATLSTTTETSQPR